MVIVKDEESLARPGDVMVLSNSPPHGKSHYWKSNNIILEQTLLYFVRLLVWNVMMSVWICDPNIIRRFIHAGEADRFSLPIIKYHKHNNRKQWQREFETSKVLQMVSVGQRGVDISAPTMDALIKLILLRSHSRFFQILLYELDSPGWFHLGIEVFRPQRRPIIHSLVRPPALWKASNQSGDTNRDR